VERLAIPHADSDAADHVTLSIGVSTCQPNGQIEANCIVQCADRALYGAKRKGRNQVKSAILGSCEDPGLEQLPDNIITFKPEVYRQAR
jgi:predicted signal transduction protein with EAL and GGDEF domain